MSTFGLSFVGRFVLEVFQSVLYQRFHSVLCYVLTVNVKSISSAALLQPSVLHS